MKDTAGSLPDTTIVAVYDTATIITGKTQHIILVENFRKPPEKLFFENPLISSILIPIVVAAVVAWVVHRLNKNKYSTEVEKLKEETKQLQRAFEPYVLSTMREIQKELFKPKINGLIELVKYSNELFNFDICYNEGVPEIKDNIEYCKKVFACFNKDKYEEFKQIIFKYKQYYPKKIREEFVPIQDLMYELYQSYKVQLSINMYEISKRDQEIMDNLPKHLEILFDAIRDDLKIDSTYMDDFLETYKTKK